MRSGLAAAALAALASASPAAGETLPFGAGERITMRVTYARLLAGRATMSVEAADDAARPLLRFVQEVKSEGFFAWLFRYRVDNRLAARWDPATGCSLGIEKRLHQGRYTRDQRVTIDPASGRVVIEDRGVPRTAEATPCVLDVLSAFYVARARGVPAGQQISVPVFDAGRSYDLVFRAIGHEELDLPRPLGRVKTLIVEPLVPAGSGLFAQEGDLKVWVTDDARRIPVRARTKVAVGSVSADLESYVPGAVTASPFGGVRPRLRSTSGTSLPTRPTPR